MAKPRAVSGSYLAHTWTVAALTLLSRIAGLLRDAVCSRAFGSGPVWSAFAFAFLIPNLFRRLFGEGALTAAFLPRYAQLLESDPALARRFATLVLGGLTVALSLLVILAEIPLVILASRSAEAEQALILRLLLIMLPYMPLICLVAMLGAVLQVHGRFGPTAAAPILLNLFIIAATLLAWSRSAVGSDLNAGSGGVTWLAWSVLLSGVVQVAWSLASLRGRHVFSANLRLADELRPHLRSMMEMFLPMLLGLGVLQINTLLDGLIAAWPVAVGPTIFGAEYPLDQSAAADIYYAQRLYQFPLGVFAIALATALYPTLARTAKDHDAFRETVRQGIRLAIFIGLPASVGLIMVARPLTATAFLGAQFTGADVGRVSAILIAYAPVVVAYSVIHILTRAWYAAGDARTPVRIASAVVLLNFLLNILLIWPLGTAGLAWSSSVTSILQCLLLLYLLNRRNEGEILAADLFRSAGRVVLIALILAAVLWAPSGLGGEVDSETTWSSEAGRLVLLVALGAGIVVGLSWLLRAPELHWLLRRRIVSAPHPGGDDGQT